MQVGCRDFFRRAGAIFRRFPAFRALDRACNCSMLEGFVFHEVHSTTMSNPVSSPATPAVPHAAPVPRVIRGVNRVGLMTFTKKEVSRFLNVYLQTVLAPMITTVIFFMIFVLALGHENEAVDGIPYLEFLAPGLIMMAMVQNAFANTSSSIVISKVQGNIVDVLMPPLSPMEILAGYMLGGIFRGLIVGLACFAVIWIFVPVHIHSWPVFIASAVLSTMMLSLMGIAGGLWSEKFDHLATVTNFVITPLSFLSGTFYSITRLPDIWKTIAEFNPFFHMIDGFRYSMIGHADSHIGMGLLMLAVVNILMFILCYRMLRTGYKIRA